LANIVDDVDSLHVEIDNLNDLLVGFCFIRSIDYQSHTWGHMLFQCRRVGLARSKDHEGRRFQVRVEIIGEPKRASMPPFVRIHYLVWEVVEMVGNCSA
jgi:hypothetical protein